MTSLSHGLAQLGATALASIKRTFPAHIPLYVCAVLFTPITVAIAFAYHARVTMQASIFFLVMVPQFCATGLFVLSVVQFFRLARTGTRSPLRDFGSWLYQAATSHDRPGNAFHTVVTITPLMVSFSALKEIIPLIRPFTWDPTFEHWDRIIGLGEAPWQRLQPLLGYPFVTFLISAAYNVWFAVIFGALIWQAFFARASTLRMHFLLAFSISWFVAGNVLAVLFSSAGPCYYGHFFSPDPYAAQLDYLRAVARDWPIWSLDIQGYLWDSYEKTKGINIGISAMPSMHVVSATLIALIGLRTNRWLGILFTVYPGFIVIGAVHLAWHYAVDAIAGVSLALLFWGIAGVIVRYQDRIEASPATPVLVS